MDWQSFAWTIALTVSIILLMMLIVNSLGGGISLVKLVKKSFAWSLGTFISSLTGGVS